MKSRNLLSCLLLLLYVFSMQTASAGKNLDCTGSNRCNTDCPDADSCKCKAGNTTAGSISFGLEVFGHIDGDQNDRAVLNFVHSEPSLTMFTPQGLRYFSSAASIITGVEGDFTASEEVTLVVTSENGEGVAYTVADGSSVGIAVRSALQDDYKLELLDGSELPVVDTEPVYVKRVDLQDDTYVLFDYVTRAALREVDTYGRITDYSMIDVVYVGGVLRQIHSAEGLIDFVTIDPDFEFEIRFYRPADVDPAGTDTNGVYSLLSSATPWKLVGIKNPAYDDQDIDETYITRVWDGRTTQWQFQYYSGNDVWEMREGEVLSDDSFNLLRQEETAEVEDSTGVVRTHTKKVRDASGNLLSETIEVREDIGDAPSVLTSYTADPDGANLITTYKYYTTGAYAGETLVEYQPDGGWTAFEYDSEGRVSLTVESWQDVVYSGRGGLSALALKAKSTATSYSPVDSNDDGLMMPDSPRTEMESIAGVVTARTWYAYYRDATGLYYQVTERATTQAAAYGDSSNLRSEKIYYATVADGESALRAGRFKSDLHADGHLISYDYAEDALGQFIVTKTRTHADAPNGVANQSTRTVSTYDTVANLVREDMFVYDGSTYQSVYYVTHDYDDDRNLEKTRRFDGVPLGRITYSASYNHGKATFVTDESGRSISTMYDILDRKIVSSIAGSTAAGVGAITQSFGYSTAATGCGCSAAKTTTTDEAGTLSMTEINETDRVKRPSRRVDVSGLETTYEYTDGGRVTTVTNPNTSARITTNYLDGRIKSMTGTGVVPEYYSYGVNTNGTTWTKVHTDTATSPRYQKTTYDLAGRISIEESPAYDGSILTTEYAYDDDGDGYGRLVSQSRPGQADTLYEYNTIGQLVRTGLDMNANGTLDFESADRITDRDRSYAFEAGAWFEVSSTAVYPTLDSASSVTVSSSKRRLSGFTGNLVSESLTVDVHDQATIQTTAIDRPNQSVTRTTNTPSSTSDAVAVTINGYLKSQKSSTVAAATIYGYDDLGRRTSIRDPRHTESTTIEYYTGTRQVFTQTDGANDLTSFTYYDNGVVGAGQVHSVTNALPIPKKSYQAYDLLGRQIQTWGQTDYPQAYSYNSYGELESLTTWRDSTGAIDFTGMSWPLWDHDGDSQTDSVEIDSSHAEASKTTWNYQPSTGLLTRKEYADTNGTDYTYTAANQLHVRTWARDGGLDTTYSYDPATGELLNVNYEAADTADITYTYDRLGRQATVADATGTRTFAYDPATLQLEVETLSSSFYSDLSLVRQVDTLGRSSGYTLGKLAANQPLDLTDFDTVHALATYGYESTGRLETVTDGTDTFTYDYKPDSNLLASMVGPVHSVAYTYAYEPEGSTDQRDLMTIIDNKVNGATNSLSTYTYNYDELGRREDRTQSGTAISTSTDEFEYNDRSEVIGSTNSDTNLGAAWNPDYTYDQIGNRKSSTGFQPVSTYATNQLNQYVDPTTLESPHDEDGNLETKGNWTYTWNGENRLINAVNSSTNASIDFSYDYQGRLVKKDDGTNVEVYAYDGWNRIFKTSALSTQPLVIQTTESFVWGLDLSGSMQGAGGVGGLLKEGDLYPTYDANGNIMQKLDGTGAIMMNVEYDPFGNIISGQLFGEYGFSTKPLIDDIQWYYYGFRYYDPVTGRWPNRDPIEEWGGVNLYGFVLNNSIDYYDFNGFMARARPPSNEPFVGGEIDISSGGKGNCLSSTLPSRKRDDQPGGAQFRPTKDLKKKQNALRYQYTSDGCGEVSGESDCKKCEEDYVKVVTGTLEKDEPSSGGEKGDANYHAAGKNTCTGKWFGRAGPNKPYTRGADNVDWARAEVGYENIEYLHFCCPKKDK